MNINRRSILFATAAVAVTTSPSTLGHKQGKRVSQQELDEAIQLHGMWLANMNIGQRCMFGERDLSGLRFDSLGGAPANLSGADFTQADLSGTEADNILVHHCSFNGARLDGSHWRQPVFAFADLRRASAKQVIWGMPGARAPLEPPRADFSHAVLHDADLTEANICGFFYGTKLVGASLVRADLCHSTFLGPKHYEMTFSGAQMRGAKLRHCQISCANLNLTSIYDRVHYFGSFANFRLRNNRHLVDCAPSTRSAPNKPFEYCGKMRLRLETNCRSDLDNRHRSGPQQLFSALNSSSQEKLVGPQARRRPELASEVHSAQSCNSRQIRQAGSFREMIFDIFDDSFEPPLLQCPDLRRSRLTECVGRRVEGLLVHGSGSPLYWFRPILRCFKLVFFGEALQRSEISLWKVSRWRLVWPAIPF